MSRCNCAESFNRDCVFWWLTGVGKERRAQILESVGAAELGTAQTVADHDIGWIVLAQWPTWFTELKAAVDAALAQCAEANGPFARILVRFRLAEDLCKYAMAGNLGFMAKAKHGDELKKLVAGNRMVRKIQEA